MKWFIEVPLWIDEEATLYLEKYNNTSAIVLKYFYQCSTNKRLKYLPPICNNSSDLSHPQNCIPIESFHSQWLIVTTVEALGSTMHINKYQHQQQIWMIDNEPSMPIYTFSSIGRPPWTFIKSPSRRNIILLIFSPLLPTLFY